MNGQRVRIPGQQNEDFVLSTDDTVDTDMDKSKAASAGPLDLLDLILVAAQVWPWLVLGPMLVGVITYTVKPADYVAFSTFSLNAVVTEPVMRSMLDKDVGENRSRNIKIDETAKMGTITVTASTADGARDAVSEALKALMLRPGLSKESTATLSAKLMRSQAETKIYETLFNELKPGIAAAISSEIAGQQNGKNDALATFITLSDKLATLNSSNDGIQKLLDSKLITSIDQEIYVNSVQSSKLVSAVLSTLLVGLAIYVAALLCHLWRLASADSRSRPKIDRIRRSLKLSRSKQAEA